MNLAQGFQKIWEWLGRNHVQIKLIFTVIVGFWVVLEYYSNLKQTKIEHSLMYIKRYQEKKVLNARTALDVPWIQQEKLESIKKSSKAEWSKKATDIAKNNKFIDVYILISFYQEMSVCAENDVCDSKTLCSFFYEDVDAFISLYKNFIDMWEESWDENITAEIDTFLNSSCTEYAMAKYAGK